MNHVILCHTRWQNGKILVNDSHSPTLPPYDTRWQMERLWPSYNDSHSPTPPPYEPLSPCLQERKCGSTTYRFEYCHMH